MRILEWSVIIIAGQVLGVSSSTACKCVSYSISQKITKADYIFEGKVTKITKVSSKVGTERHKIFLEGVKSWKGIVGNQVLVFTHSLGTQPDCGYPFELGESYIVLASGKNEKETTSCSGTKKLNEATDLLKVIEAR